MFPKEHGAWNALLVSLAAGWAVLHGFNPAALALTLLWTAGFILRAPLSTFRQYRKADPGKAGRALVWALLLAFVVLASLYSAWKKAPGSSFCIVAWSAAPALVLLVLFLRMRTLHFLFAEALGFLTLCLCAPAIYLTGPSSTTPKAGLLYLLIGGFFFLAVLYVGIRFEWMRRNKPGDRRRSGERRQTPRGLLDLSGVLILGLAWLGAVHFYPGTTAWQLAAPCYALARMAAGALWGDKLIEPMTLGMREMVHSIVFLGLVLAAW